MENEFEYALRVEKENKYASLYKWYIDEVTQGGKVVKRPTSKYIPWKGHAEFAVNDIRHISNKSFSQQRATGFQEAGGYEQITGSLVPITISGSRDDRPVYSMFGTQREIEDFTFHIYPVKLEKEGYELAGMPQYTVELDFSHETEPDAIQLDIYLETQKFLEIVKLLEEDSLTSMTIWIEGLSGLYDSWSPSYRSSHLKILTPDHELEIPEDIDCPRFGEMRKLEIFTETRRFLPATKSGENPVLIDDDEDSNVESDIEKSITSERVVYELVVLQKTLEKQTKFHWATVILLLVLIFMLV